MIIRRLNLETGQEGEEEHVAYTVGHRLVTGNGGTTRRMARWVNSEPGEPQWVAPVPMRSRARSLTTVRQDRMMRREFTR